MDSMRTAICLLLVAMAVSAEESPIKRLAGASFKVADLEKSRQFYTGMLGLEEAFDIKDSSGTVQSAFFKVNDEQYLQFSPGAAKDFEMESVWFLTPDLNKTAATLRNAGLNPAKAAKSLDGAMYIAIKDADQTELRFVRFGPGSEEDDQRGNALGGRRVSDHLQHVGVASDHEAENMAIYRDKLGMKELFRGGPIDGETRWINMGMPSSPGDMLELMILASEPAQGRRHIAFEVPDIQKTYKELIRRGLPAKNFKPNPGLKQNPGWILNLRDPNGFRVEFMGELVAAK
jgi:catechol 2,3-dioxygenase-like lactoylglutathione lyase family enzyme